MRDRAPVWERYLLQRAVVLGDPDLPVSEIDDADDIGLAPAIPLRDGVFPRSSDCAAGQRVDEEFPADSQKEGRGGHEEGGDDVLRPGGANLEGVPPSMGQGEVDQVVVADMLQVRKVRGGREGG